MRKYLRNFVPSPLFEFEQRFAFLAALTHSGHHCGCVLTDVYFGLLSLSTHQPKRFISTGVWINEEGLQYSLCKRVND